MVKKRVPKTVEKKIKEFVNILRQDKLPISRVVLFGSYAKGKQQSWSDIDLCIVSPKFINPFLAMQYLWQKRPSDSGLTIEPIGFTPRDFHDDNSLTWEIKKTGIEIKIPSSPRRGRGWCEN